MKEWKNVGRLKGKMRDGQPTIDFVLFVPKVVVVDKSKVGEMAKAFL